MKKTVINYLWKIYGKTIRNPSLPSNIKSVLFVCKGNICRSPFAEYYSSKHLSVSNSLLYYSAGIQVEHLKPPPIEAIASAKYFDIDLHNHKSREINYTMIGEYDLITVMEAWQFNYLRRKFAIFRNKIVLLPLFERHEGSSSSYYDIYNIRDPYGKKIIYYEECFRRIKGCLTELNYVINKDKHLGY